MGLDLASVKTLGTDDLFLTTGKRLCDFWLRARGANCIMVFPHLKKEPRGVIKATIQLDPNLEHKIMNLSCNMRRSISSNKSIIIHFLSFGQT